MPFEFATATRIVFGPGTLPQLGTAARELGRHALIVTGRDPTRAARARELLARVSVATTVFSVAREPASDDIVEGVTQARAAGCDFVVGFGGGAALDAAKAISGLLTNDGNLLDYLEVVGRGRPLHRPAAPCIAIPTTAGTGSEVTRNAVLSAPATDRSAAFGSRVKVSLRSPHLLPRLALVDPELTHSLPPGMTAATGLDALTQLIEPYLSSRANPLTDALCIEGIRRVSGSLRLAFHDGNRAAARTDMALASLLGGLALANAGLGAVHGFAGPIGGMFDAPHGAVCAALLPHVMAANVRALQSRAPRHPALARFDELGRLLTDAPHATATNAIHWVADLVSELRIPPLVACGVSPEHFPAIVAASAKASSMKANPLPLTEDELHAILFAAVSAEPPLS